MSEKKETVVVKRTKNIIEKINVFSAIKRKLPNVPKRIILLILVTLAIPFTVLLAMLQQEIRSRADQGNRKIFLGMSTHTSAGKGNDLSAVQTDLEKIKTTTGVYPAAYAIWVNAGTPSQLNLDVLNYLNTKGITPMVNLLPVSGEMERRDGRFIFSSDITYPFSSFNQGQLRFNSSNPSSVTKILVSKTSSGTEATGELANTWVPRETIRVLGSNSNGTIAYEGSNFFEFNIVNNTDKGTYWELDVTVKTPGQLSGVFSNGKPVFITMSDYYGRDWGNGRIAAGKQDDNFREIGNILKQFGKPVIVRYAWEMNGDWFPWSAGRRDNRISYGRYRYFDMGNTAANYVSAWKYLYNLYRGSGGLNASNILFFWCGAAYSGGYSSYFPGDGFVDYVGFDTYSGIGGSNHANLSDLARGPVNSLTSISSKGIIIGEIGVNSIPKQISPDQFPTWRKNWLRNGYPYLYENFPRIKGIVYFNLDMRGSESNNNWLLSNDFSPKSSPDSIPAIMSVYKNLLSDPRFQGRLINPPTTVTPTPTSPPTDTKGDKPFGYNDSASCTNITGWTCDPDNFNKSLKVEIYADGPEGVGDLVGNGTANLTRESAVAGECGGVSTHGFSLSTPVSLKDGGIHKVYVYGVDDADPSKLGRLYFTPRVLRCSTTTLTPTPSPTQEPAACVRHIPSVTYGDLSKSGKRGETKVFKVTIQNNDSIGCKNRKITVDLDLSNVGKRWDYSPEYFSLPNGATKTYDIKVTSGKFAGSGTKNFPLTISNSKDTRIFSTATIKYTVIE